jgi:hypothetical protein
VVPLVRPVMVAVVAVSMLSGKVVHDPLDAARYSMR